jgi:hypothetical protein
LPLRLPKIVPKQILPVDESVVVNPYRDLDNYLILLEYQMVGIHAPPALIHEIYRRQLVARLSKLLLSDNRQPELAPLPDE